MLHVQIAPLERKGSTRLGSKSPVTDFISKAKAQGSSQPAKTQSRSKQAPAPIIQTRIPREFMQVYIAANRGEEVEIPPSAPVRQLPRRTKSCLSSRSLRASLEEPPVRKTTRTVSFGAVKGITIENIAVANKNSLWFSRDEYSSMRQEAFEIAKVTRKKGTLKESSQITSRGLEKYIDQESTTLQVARQSVLEHHDLAMYALASNRAVRTARQLAEMDALEAFSIQQQDSAFVRKPPQRSRGKLLSP